MELISREARKDLDEDYLDASWLVSGIPAAAMLVLSVLARLGSATRRELRAQGIADTYVIDGINDLERMGIVEVGKRGSANLYTLPAGWAAKYQRYEQREWTGFGSAPEIVRELEDEEFLREIDEWMERVGWTRYLERRRSGEDQEEMPAYQLQTG